MEGWDGTCMEVGGFTPVQSYRLDSDSDGEAERQVDERNRRTEAKFRAPTTLSPRIHRAATASSECGSSRTGVSENTDKYLPYFKKSSEIMEKHGREAALFAAKGKLPEGGPFKDETVTYQHQNLCHSTRRWLTYPAKSVPATNLTKGGMEEGSESIHGIYFTLLND